MISLMISQIQHFEADFLWKVSLKILNSGITLKTFPHEGNIHTASPKASENDKKMPYS